MAEWTEIELQILYDNLGESDAIERLPKLRALRRHTKMAIASRLFSLRIAAELRPDGAREKPVDKYVGGEGGRNRPQPSTADPRRLHQGNAADLERVERELSPRLRALPLQAPESNYSTKVVPAVENVPKPTFPYDHPDLATVLGRCPRCQATRHDNCFVAGCPYR